MSKMNKFLIHLGMSFLIASLLLPSSLAADGDKGVCKNVADDRVCGRKLRDCVRKNKPEKYQWMVANCAKACFFCDTEKCADVRDDCEELKRKCTVETSSIRGQCMKTCGTCPSLK